LKDCPWDYIQTPLYDYIDELMLVYPDYELGNGALTTIWQCIESREQDIKKQQCSFEQQPTPLLEPILQEINETLKRIKFVPLNNNKEGSTDPNTGNIFCDPKLIRKILGDFRKRDHVQLECPWVRLTDILMHELIHQAQYNLQPEIFAAYHKEHEILCSGKSYWYCQASNRYEIQAHAYTDATQIRKWVKNQTRRVSLDAAKAMVSRESANCRPQLFYKELLNGEGVLEAARILEEYKSSVCAYLDELDRQPEPEMFVPNPFRESR
jgi:hypothetical protein